MKKWKAVLSLLLIFVFFSSPGFAAAKHNKIAVSMDGRKHTVTEVPVLVDGQAINIGIPNFIHRDYTFVPIRFVERYGAKVNWDQKTKTATVIQNSKEIKMTINSRDIYVNGQKKVVDKELTPKFVTFANKDTRTMIPFRLVSEILGYEVGWDNANRVPFINTKVEENPDGNSSAMEVTDIFLDKGSTSIPNIVINGTDNFKYSTALLENPNRFVIDIEDAKLNLKGGIPFEGGVGVLNVNSGSISKLNVSQFSLSPNVVRIVVHLTEKVDFEIQSGNEGKSITISPVNKVVNLNKVGNIKKEKINGKEAIVIYNEFKPKINTMKFNNPERIVIDLLDSSLEAGDYVEYNHSIGLVEKVRASQFIPDNNYKPDDKIVRVVLDIKDGVSDPNVKIDTYDDRIVITPETSIWEAVDYSFEGANRIISINANREIEYNVDYNSHGKVMTISLPSDSLDLEEGYTAINDGLIKDIRVVKERNASKVIINFIRSAEYSILSKNMDNKITLSLKRDSNIKPSDRVIVIDPGHGGKDPGTVQNGIREKDVNLAVSHKLNEGLKDKGYTTIMTREDDIFIELKERANIANRNGADLFISIHSNSHPNGNVSGIQILYHSKNKANVTKEETYNLANIIMDEMTKGTGAQNKGLLAREKTVVIRDTAMPSVLIELGFLTNIQEAQLLTDETYQDLLVESIIKGIERYFEIY